MKDLKLAIAYYSSTGTNYQLAQWAAEAGKETGAEVKVLKFKELAPEAAIAANPDWQAHYEATKDVAELSLDDLEWADAIVISAPTRYGGLPSQVRQFLDTTGGLWSQGLLANKVVTGMTSASNPHGGQESTLLSLYTSMYHWGAIVAAPGYTDPTIFAAGGNPYGVSVTAGKDNLTDEVKAAVTHQVKRAVTIAKWVVKGVSES